MSITCAKRVKDSNSCTTRLSSTSTCLCTITTSRSAPCWIFRSVLACETQLKVVIFGSNEPSRDSVRQEQSRVSFAPVYYCRRNSALQRCHICLLIEDNHGDVLYHRVDRHKLVRELKQEIAVRFLSIGVVLHQACL